MPDSSQPSSETGSDSRLQGRKYIGETTFSYQEDQHTENNMFLYLNWEKYSRHVQYEATHMLSLFDFVFKCESLLTVSLFFIIKNTAVKL